MHEQSGSAENNGNDDIGDTGNKGYKQGLRVTILNIKVTSHLKMLLSHPTINYGTETQWYHPQLTIFISPIKWMKDQHYGWYMVFIVTEPVRNQHKWPLLLTRIKSNG